MYVEICRRGQKLFRPSTPSTWCVYGCISPPVCSGSLTHRNDNGVDPLQFVLDHLPTDMTMVWIPSSLFWITYPTDMTMVWIPSSLFWITYPQIWQWCGSPPVCSGSLTHRYDNGVDPLRFVVDHLPTDMTMVWMSSSLFWITYPQIWQWCGSPPVCCGSLTHRYDNGVDPLQFVVDHLPTDMTIVWMPSSLFWITYSKRWQWCGSPFVCCGSLTHRYDNSVDPLQFVLDGLGDGVLLADVRVSVREDDGEVWRELSVTPVVVEDLFAGDDEGAGDVRPTPAILDSLHCLKRNRKSYQQIKSNDVML